MKFIGIIDKSCETAEGVYRRVALAIDKDGKMHFLGGLLHNTEIEFPAESIAALNEHYKADPLIAAAPDLLEACKKLVELAPKLWGLDKDEWPRVMDRIEAAVAKATT